MSSKAESKPEQCPQCDNMTLTILPGAKRKTCSLCGYTGQETISRDDEEENTRTPSFRMVSNAELSRYKGKKKGTTLHLSSLIWIALLATAVYVGLQYYFHEPEELEGLHRLEQNYQNLNRYMAKEELKAPSARQKTRKELKQDQKSVLRLKVSPCLDVPRLSLIKLYDYYDKSLAKPNYKVGMKSRYAVNTGMRFITGIEKCKENYEQIQNKQQE
ncbi:hypothetical protein COW36_17550 [bacterium (Candidatus Blackallbacteria) CG17_big_fil_post_rev_8_21_14_2_50_48_46]|uniref:Uncharacterized protein n=1 Tax=bacterium (Candidatus Blackallbacteria) CG17_big_fil_post_rev_8_21_14_2_50_48_46 TaxID=2014261 RepID=A0A2M7G110_9BACT|nr:MAG: hypothetical protein COW64_01180 [bacterium (Candidatus Blackallbacteria) CG18_big_fil_WC_8_21_14_2_50_49_26]PIW15227.1 MAG: hypothetical protein COW36_17550 [bacterium (Candidatus Blackallbacteria) CG17_big_fil_post_rev_8_21_14_2_50_48_46]PIW44814.1 MAG: hypothetical protein COW20_22885 [bacterium (Candidatus Blackallbacteria) CG13_big_fil_rev_8_21_14_2_50_49_14]